MEAARLAEEAARRERRQRERQEMAVAYQEQVCVCVCMLGGKHQICNDKKNIYIIYGFEA
jgi:hypothetical protein